MKSIKTINQVQVLLGLMKNLLNKTNLYLKKSFISF